MPFTHSQYFVLLWAEWPYSFENSQIMPIFCDIRVLRDANSLFCLLLKRDMQVEVDTNI
jgi:hypothetical protein